MLQGRSYSHSIAGVCSGAPTQVPALVDSIRHKQLRGVGRHAVGYWARQLFFTFLVVRIAPASNPPAVRLDLCCVGETVGSFVGRRRRSAPSLPPLPATLAAQFPRVLQSSQFLRAVALRAAPPFRCGGRDGRRFSPSVAARGAGNGAHSARAGPRVVRAWPLGGASALYLAVFCNDHAVVTP